MQRLKWSFLMIAIFILITGCANNNSHTPSSSKGTTDCFLKTFDRFAYEPDDASLPIQKILPNAPWQLESIIPGQEDKSYTISDTQIKLTRQKDNQEEIWIFKAPDYNGRDLIEEASFLIYYPERKTWTEVSAKIANTNLVVRNLFVTSDGTIWGSIDNQQDRQEPPFPSKAPVLSRFNESNQTFEAAAGILDIPIPEEERGLIDAPEVILDKQDIFWIFAREDGVYRYDPQTQTTGRQVNLPKNGMDRLSTALALDGSIFVQDKSLHRTDEFLFQFFPEKGEFTTLDVSKEPWEASSGMLVDQKGRLWLGAMGYMETDGSWHLLHRNAPKVWENLGEMPYWSPPTLIYESSDGLLWYTEYHDTERLGEGTAWYNPETKEGCLFTNMASYIIEDANKQLWMVADGNLYRYPLEE
jgi:hypothetical protein